MLGAVLLVLIIGALLAVIFGRGVAQRFVLGTATLASVCIAAVGIIVLVIVVIGIVQMQAVPQPASAMSLPSVSIYPPPESVVTTSGSNLEPTASATPMPQAAPVGARPFDNVYNPLASPAPTVAAGPSIGIVQEPTPDLVSAQFSMSPGFGLHVVAVKPGGPAAEGGLLPDDYILAMDDDPITVNHTLNDYEARKGAGHPIQLSVEHSWSGGWVHRWVTVTPR